MAKTDIPTPLVRRDLLETMGDKAQALKIAEAYLADDRVLEAVAFLGVAEAWDRLAEVRERVIEEGDAFVLRNISELQGREPSADEWSRLAAAATAAGKSVYAATALRQSQRSEDQAE